MLVDGRHYRSIWYDQDTRLPTIIDQTELPHRFVTRALSSATEAAEAIKSMRVRGAPLIGATAAHGLALALRDDPSTPALESAVEEFAATRPTAINLRWALDRIAKEARSCREEDRAETALRSAIVLCDEDVRACEAIGENGLALLQARAAGCGHGNANAPLQILTHCNAGWLATVDWGTALAPIYKAHAAGLAVHVWVDETRPRNQGASLTAYELRQMGIDHTVIVDNAGGHLMQRGQVDLVLVGSDRTTARGDVCNKIGTYLKALAAHDNGVPFYVALPLSTIDGSIEDGLSEIPIEERDASEVREMVGIGVGSGGAVQRVELFSKESAVANPAFDVTPARYVTQLVTEVGACVASRPGLDRLRGMAAKSGVYAKRPTELAAE